MSTEPKPPPSERLLALALQAEQAGADQLTDKYLLAATQWEGVGK